MNLRIFKALALAGVLALPAYALENGYLGVRIGELPDALAAYLEVETGVLVTDVSPDGAASRAGIQPHDVILAVDGTKIEGTAALMALMRSRSPGDEVTLELLRKGKARKVSVVLGERPPPSSGFFSEHLDPLHEDFVPADEGAVADENARGFLGVHYGEVVSALRSQLSLGEGEGVLVEDVLPDGPAASSGIEKNDVLLSVDGESIRGGESFSAIMTGTTIGQAVEIVLVRGGRLMNVSVLLGEVPDNSFFPADRDFTEGFLELHPEGFPQKFRGNLFFRDPDGNQQQLHIPDFHGQMPDFGKWMDTILDERFQDVEPKMRERIRELMEQLPQRLHVPQDLSFPAPDADHWRELMRKRMPAPDGQGNLFPHSVPGETQSSSSSVSHWRDDHIDITMKEENGFRTVTAKRDGKVLAEDVPLGDIDSLPAEIREKVKWLSENQAITGPPQAFRRRLPGPVDKGRKL